MRALSPLVWAIAGLATYIVGSTASLIAHNPDVFQRFGSLGVAAAILFFTDRLLKIELNRQQSVEAILHEYGLRFEVMQSGIKPTEMPEKGYSTDYLDEEQAFTRLRRRAERINAVNIVLLTVSTLQWGFGAPILRALAS